MLVNPGILQAGVGNLTESSQIPRDIDLSPGQPLQSSQSSGSLGVIGRRSVADLGAIGDNLSVSTPNSGGMHDQLYNLQMLEAAFYKLPQPKDSERAKSYTPVVTNSFEISTYKLFMFFLSENIACFFHRDTLRRLLQVILRFRHQLLTILLSGNDLELITMELTPCSLHFTINR